MANILDLIGNTPLVEILNLNTNKDVKIFAKLEGNNPGGSVKDRAAYSMIKGALERGEIKKGTRLIEATSGNTGIALALIAGLYKVEIELVMPEDASQERIATMKAFGAKVILTPKERSMEGAIDYVTGKSSGGGYLVLNQFANNDNWLAHYKTTGPEIWRDTNGGITHFVSAMGTTGTIMGVSKYLKEKNEDIQIVGCQPADNSRIPGIRKWAAAYLPKFYDAKRVDRMIELSENDAVSMTKKLARFEGVFAGISSGGAMHAAFEVARSLNKGVIVVIICDRGDRYLSSGIF